MTERICVIAWRQCTRIGNEVSFFFLYRRTAIAYNENYIEIPI